MNRSLSFRTAKIATIAASFAWIAGCAGDETVQPVATSPSYKGTLDLEIRGTADITIEGAAPPEMKVAILVNGAAAPHLLDDGTKLEGAGRVEPLPEAGMELYAAKLSLPADPEGPCGAEPRSVALSLTRRTKASRVAGALTVYCGASFSGVPQRVLRITGQIQRI